MYDYIHFDFFWQERMANMKRARGSILAMILAVSLTVTPMTAAYAAENTQDETIIETAETETADFGLQTDISMEPVQEAEPSAEYELEAKSAAEFVEETEISAEPEQETEPSQATEPAPETITEAELSEEESETAESEEELLEAPVISSVSNVVGGVKITWSSVENAPLYRIYRRTADTDWEVLAYTEETSYVDDSAVSGTKYFYTVQCVREDGETAASTYDETGKGVSYVAAPVISGLEVTNSGVKITWGKAAGAAKYRVFRKNASGGWSKVADTAETTYTDTAPTAGASYTYTIRCLDASGSFASAYDNTGKSIVFAAKPAISSISSEYTGVKVTWGKIADAAKYRVYRKSGSGSWAKVGDTASTSYTDTSAAGGSKYSYTVRCLDGAGNFISGYDSTGKSITYVAAPVLKSVSNVYGGVTVTWAASAGAAKYRVYRKSGSGSWAKVADTTALTYTDKTVAAGTTYAYTVRCLDSAGATISSYNSAGLSITYIAAPAVSSVSNVVGGVKISWAKSDGVAQYRLYRKSGSGSWAKIADTTAFNYTDKSVTSGTKYSYTLRCMDSAGNLISGFDPAGKAITYVAAPAISGVSNVYGGVSVTWSKVTGAAKYRVYRKSGSGSWAKVGDTAETSYTDKTAASGTKYSYTVRCLDSAGATVSSYDSTGKSITYVAAPAISGAENVTGGVKISWGKVAGASKYRLYRKTGSGSWTRITDTTALTYTDKNVTGGTKYSYTVRCLDADGNTISGYNPSGKTITYVAVPKLSSVSNVFGGVSVSWGKVTGAAKYRVYRKSGSGSWAKVGDTTSTSFTDKTAKSGTKYSYTVRCLDSAGNTVSSYDSTGLSITYVAAPVISSVTNVLGGVKISWGKVTGASKYRVYRKTSSGSWTKIADTSSLSYVDETGKNGTKYFYTVRSLNSAGDPISSYDPAGKAITCQKKVMAVDYTNIQLSNLFGMTDITVTFLYEDENDYVAYEIEDPTLIACEWDDTWYGYETTLHIYAGTRGGTTYIKLTNSINNETIRIKVTVVDDITYVTN